jgi:pyruvate dehydrogenase E1 component beta subunit
MREVTYAEALYEALTEEMRRDERVFIMGEDVGRFGMIYLARPQLWKEFGDERVRDTPISENAIVGFTLGAAITGMRPVADQGAACHPLLFGRPSFSRGAAFTAS